MRKIAMAKIKLKLGLVQTHRVRFLPETANARSEKKVENKRNKSR